MFLSVLGVLKIYKSIIGHPSFFSPAHFFQWPSLMFFLWRVCASWPFRGLCAFSSTPIGDVATSCGWIRPFGMAAKTSRRSFAVSLCGRRPDDVRKWEELIGHVCEWRRNIQTLAERTVPSRLAERQPRIRQLERKCITSTCLLESVMMLMSVNSILNCCFRTGHVDTGRVGLIGRDSMNDCGHVSLPLSLLNPKTRARREKKRIRVDAIFEKTSKRQKKGEKKVLIGQSPSGPSKRIWWSCGVP